MSYGWIKTVTEMSITGGHCDDALQSVHCAITASPQHELHVRGWNCIRQTCCSSYQNVSLLMLQQHFGHHWKLLVFTSLWSEIAYSRGHRRCTEEVTLCRAGYLMINFSYSKCTKKKCKVLSETFVSESETR